MWREAKWRVGMHPFRRAGRGTYGRVGQGNMTENSAPGVVCHHGTVRLDRHAEQTVDCSVGRSFTHSSGFGRSTRPQPGKGSRAISAAVQFCWTAAPSAKGFALTCGSDTSTTRRTRGVSARWVKSSWRKAWWSSWAPSFSTSTGRFDWAAATAWVIQG